MPYALRGTTVVNRATGAPVPGGKHPNRAKALAHLRALYANVPEAKDYSAHVGQVIAGRLVRGAGGKFSSSGAAAPASERVPFKALPKAPKPKKGKAPKKGKRALAKPKAPKAPKKTPAERAAASAAAHQGKIAAQRQSVIDAMAAQDAGLAPAGAKALLDFADGKALSAQAAPALEKMGLLEKDASGQLRISQAGHAAVAAMNRGDTRGALDAISRAGDRAAKLVVGSAKPKKASSGGKRVGGGSRTARTPRAPAPPPARSSTPVKLTGGGGGGAAARQPAKQGQSAQVPQQLHDAAQTLSDGGTLNQSDADALIRNGLARRLSNGTLILTSIGLRTISTKAAGSPGDYLVVEDPKKSSTWHLQVRTNGKPDHRLMGAAWAALHGGYRGPPSARPNKGAAVSKRGALYASEKMPLPSEKEARSPMRPSVQTHGTTAAPAGTGNTPLLTGQRTVADPASARDTSLPHPFTVFKDANGSWRWIARTTTAFEDRDNEVISTKALDDDVIRADGDGKYGPLRWWHMGKPNVLDTAAPWGPGVDLGWTDFNAMSGKTLIESGTFKSEAIAQAVASKADDLELSPGFFHAANEPDQTGVFTHIHRFERSLVPKWAGRASNPYTGLIVQGKEAMDEKKIQALKDLGIPEATINALVADVQQTEKAAEADNVRYKDSPVKDFFKALITGDWSQATTKEDEPPATEVAPAVAAEPEAPPDPLATLKAELETLRAEVATLKAPQVPMDAEDDPAQGGDAGADEAAEGEPPIDDGSGDAGGLTLSSEDLGAIGQLLQSLLEPLIGALGITQKLEGHLGELKTMMGGYTKTKDDAQAAQANEVAALKASIDQQQAKLAELIGSEPRAGYRASEAPDNVLNPQVLAAMKDNGDMSGTDFSDIAQQLFPGMIRR